MMLDTGSQNSVLSEAAANRLGIVRDALHWWRIGDD
jgi:predicted aspartyl protease